MVHSVVLAAVLAALMKYAAFIPMPAIAAILINVAYNMCGWKNFVNLVKTSPKSDVIVLVATFLLTVIFDLVVAIEIGVIAACILLMKRMSEESGVKGWKYSETDENDKPLMNVPSYVSVFEFSGPMFFAVASQISNIIVKPGISCVILRMRAVPSLDTDAMRSLETLISKCSSKGAAVIMSHVNPQPLKAMKKSGLYELVGAENFCADINSAMQRAKQLSPKQ